MRTTDNIYVKTEKAGNRVLESVKHYLEKKLKLRVNPKKSKVERVKQAKFLGFSFFKREGKTLIRVAARTLERFTERIRQMTRRTRAGTLEEIVEEINRYTRGCIGYYRLARTPSVYGRLDEWLRAAIA